MDAACDAAAGRTAANIASFLALPRASSEQAEHSGLLRLYLDAQEQEHETSLAEIKAGQKSSHWIWWEWPAYAPVRSTSHPEYDLPSCHAATAWLAHELLGRRWKEITIDCKETLQRRTKKRRPKR